MLWPTTVHAAPPLLLIADFDSALKAVESEYAAAEKELGGTRKKAEDAAAAMKALEHKDTKVRLWDTSHTPMRMLYCNGSCRWRPDAKSLA